MIPIVADAIGAPFNAVGTLLSSAMGTLQSGILYGIGAIVFNFGAIPLMERNGAEETAAAFKKALGVQGSNPNWHSVLKTTIAAMGIDFGVRTTSNLYSSVTDEAAQHQTQGEQAASTVAQVAAIGGTVALAVVGLKAAGVEIDWDSAGDSVKKHVITPAHELGKDLGKVVS